jgi:hypothetical protein
MTNEDTKVDITKVSKSSTLTSLKPLQPEVEDKINVESFRKWLEAGTPDLTDEGEV